MLEYYITLRNLHFKNMIKYFGTKIFKNEVRFPGGSDSKESAHNAVDLGSLPGSGRPPGEGNGNPLQYSCLDNPMDRGAWRAIIHGVADSQHD